MKAFSGKVKVLFVLVLSFISSLGYSQVDKEFWFSCPYVNKNHGIFIQSNSTVQTEALGGGSPIYLRISALGNPVTVRVNTPANTTNGYDTTVFIAAFGTATLDLTKHRDILEVTQNFFASQSAENKGLHIVSNDNITAYYENATIPNPEIFTLKGVNALGKEFYTPFQTIWPNDPIHSSYLKAYMSKVPLNGNGWHPITINGNSSTPYDTAYSSFDIVATMDNTIINITPTTNVVGHPKGVPFTVVLAKQGQTYTVRQLDQAIASLANWGPSINDSTVNVWKLVGSNRPTNNLSGSHVTSNNPIAISIKDDSMFPNDITESGDCEDYIGDQIIPVNIIGKQYVVMKGALNKATSRGTLTDYVFLESVKAGTIVTIDDGVNAPSNITFTTAGQTQSIPVTTPRMYISATDSIYAFHVTGYNGEFASAILPPLSNCNGSNDVEFTRTYATWNNEKLFANVLVMDGGQTTFASDIPSIANKINAATFTPIGATGWNSAQISFTNAEMPYGPHRLYNTAANFHLGLIYSTVYSWNTTWNDNPTDKVNGKIDSTEIPILQGASYGYFSNFTKTKPKAIISNNNAKSIQVPQGVKVQLSAVGGATYDWVGYMKNSNGITWDSITTPSNYYLNNTTTYNPIFDGTAPVGKYLYKSYIHPSCDNVYLDTVFIEVVPPITFNNVTDSICEDIVGTGIGKGYNLNNLNDTILGVQGKAMKYAVSDWFVKKTAGNQILDDAESNINVTYTNLISSALTESVTNTVTDGINTSLVCNKITNILVTSNNPSYSVDINLPNSIQLKSSVTINMQVRPDISSNPGWLSGLSPMSVTLNLTDGTNIVSATQTFTSADWKGGKWEQMAFVFPANTNGFNYNKVTMALGNGVDWAPMTFYFDNMNWFLPARTEAITNPTNYTFHNNDTVYAHITNPQLPYFSDTAKVIMGVYASGRIALNKTLPKQCATTGYTLKCVDLTQYKYAVGGALVANKIWYLDTNLQQKVIDPTCVDVQGPITKFFARIADSCQHIGTLEFNITEVPIVKDSVVTHCADPNSAGNSASGIQLDNYIPAVLPYGGNFTIEWYSDAALKIFVLGTNNQTVQDKQIFYAKIYSGTSPTCYAVAQLQFNITPVPNVTITASNLCLNADPITLTAVPVGGVFSIDGVISTNYIFDPKTEGLGNHDVTDSITVSGCLVVKHQPVVVYDVPTATITMNPVSPINFNSSTTLTAVVTGNGKPGYTYQWSPVASITGSATIQSPSTILLKTPQTYCVTVTDLNGCKADTCNLVDVKGAPLAIKIDAIAGSICLGDAVNLVSTPQGGVTNYKSILWSSTSGFTAATQNTTDTPTSTGSITYSVTVTDAADQTATDQVTVMVNPVPHIDMNDTAICSGTSLTLAPTITGDAGASYSWNSSPIVLAPRNGKTVVIDATQAANPYPVTFNVTSGSCIAKKTITVTINDSPTATITDIPGACSLIATQFTANVSGGTIPYTSLWTELNNNPGLNDPTLQNPTFTSGVYGFYSYTYHVTDAKGCKATATMKKFSLNAPPVAAIANGLLDSVCQNATSSYLLKSSVISGGIQPFTYTWSGTVGGSAYSSSDMNAIIDISKPTTANLTLVVKDSIGCKSTVGTTLLVNPAPIAIINEINPTVCQGVNLTLSSFATGTGFTYKWIASGNDLTPPTNASSVVFNSTVVNEHSIELDVTDNKTGCTASTTTTKVTVNPKPSVMLTDTTVCFHSSFQLNPVVTPVPSGIDSKIWTIDTLTLSSSTSLNPTFNASAVKDYKLNLDVTENGCIGSHGMTVHVLAPPVAVIDSVLNPLSAIAFTLNGSNSTGTAPLQYLWAAKPYITGSLTTVSTTASITAMQTFTLTVTDNNGCKGIATMPVNITNTQPTITPINYNICKKKTLTITAIAGNGNIQNGYKYVWYNINDLTTPVGTTASITVTASAQAVYQVQMTNDPYPMVSTNDTISFNANALQYSIAPSLPISACTGQPKALTASSTQAGVTFTWDDGSPLTVNGQTYTFNSANVGTTSIKLNIINENKSCKDSTILPITVNKSPTVSIVPNNPVWCAQTSNTLTAIPSPAGSYNYTWKQGTAIVGTDSPNYLFTQNTFGPAVMQVEVKDANGCIADTTETIKINELPQFTLPKDTIGCTGQPLVLNLNPDKKPNADKLSIIWGGDTKDLDQTVIIAPTFTSNVENVAGNIVTYQVSEPGNTCVRKDTITIHEYSAPIFTLADAQVCVGQSLQLFVQPIGYKSITWSGFVVPRSNPQFADFTANQVPGPYHVIVTVSSNQYCKTTDTALITVNDLPHAIVNPYPVSIPSRSKLVLSGYADPKYGVPSYTGLWLPPDNLLSSTGFTAQTKALFSSSQTNFVLQVTDGNGCIGKTPISIVVDGVLDIKIKEDSTNKPVDPKFPVDSSSYPLNELKENFDNICYGESVTLLSFVTGIGGSGNYSYKWTKDNDPTFISTAANIKVQDTVTTTYTLEVNDITNGIYPIATSKFKVIVNQLPMPYFTYSGLLYTGKPIYLLGNQGFATYDWSGTASFGIKPKNTPNPVFSTFAPGTFSVIYKVTDFNGCVGTYTKLIPIKQQDTINVAIPDIVCGNGTPQAYTVLNPDNGTYDWTVKPSVPFLNNVSSGKSVIIIWNTPGTYTITVENVDPFSIPKIANEITVTVVKPIDVNSIVGPQDVCEYDKSNYSIQADPGTTVTWSVVSDNRKIITPRTANNITVQWATAGLEDITIDATNGACTASLDYPVTVHKIPTAKFYARPLDSATVKDIYSSKEVDFDNRSYLYSPKEIDNKNLKYYWDFIGDGVFVQDVFEPQYSYDEKGTYMASLIAVDPIWGCRDIDTEKVVVVVNPHCSVKYPNAFTPEGKTDNKFTYGYSEGLVDKDYNLQIFNRWGQLLWETNNRTDKWDGTFKGAVCKQDVYVYHSTATCENGQVVKTNGDVTLIK
jgi:gliding motility-associated-like protein